MSTGESRAVLFLLAHHDDEVFCAGALARALAERRRVRMLWATAGGLAPAGWRLAEGRTVVRLLRLGPEDVRLLGLSDQRAAEHLEIIEEAALGLCANVGAIYAPAWEGGHPDHDALCLLGARLCARLQHDGAKARCFEFGLYRRGRWGLAVKAPFEPGEPRLGPGALALRRALMRANASQAPSLAALALAGTLQGTWPSEPVREVPEDRDWTLPPAAEPLLYRAYTRWDFARFREATGN